MTAIRFTDPVVQAEIEKSLRSSLGKIKPDSSKVEMTVRPNPGTTSAIVTYATPVAAWKIRYQLRLSSRGGGTGRPGRRGQRHRRRLGRDADHRHHRGADHVLDRPGRGPSPGTGPGERRGGPHHRGGRRRAGDAATHARSSDGALALEDVVASSSLAWSRSTWSSRPGPHEAQVTYGMERAEQPQAEVRESGDFSVFTSPEPRERGGQAVGDHPAVQGGRRRGPGRPVLQGAGRPAAAIPGRPLQESGRPLAGAGRLRGLRGRRLPGQVRAGADQARRGSLAGPRQGDRRPGLQGDHPARDHAGWRSGSPRGPSTARS